MSKKQQITAAELARMTVLTVPEYADVMRCGRRQAYEQVAAGRVPVIRVGRAIKIPAGYVRDQLGIPAA